MIPVKAKAGIPSANRRVSKFVSSQMPSYFSEQDSLLIPFIESYYEWMEQSGGVISDTANLTSFMDIDTTTMDRFGQYFRDEFIPSIPSEVLADKALLIKHIKSFYRARGSEKSLKFLFRILYNEDVEVSYPSVDILRTSDGVWLKKQIIKLDAFDDEISSVAGRKLYGTLSNASCIVEKVTLYQTSSYSVAEIEVTGMSGLFFIDEPLETRDQDDSNFPKIYARILGQTSSVIIQNAGIGYTTGEIIQFSNPGDGEGLVARIGSVDFNGEIRSIQLIDTGVGYSTTAPTPNMLSMSGVGAQLQFNISPIFYSPGQYLDTRGRPSSLSKLQDGTFYQDYSYVLKSQVSNKVYDQIIDRLVHPAGMARYGEQIIWANPDDNEGLKVLYHLSHPTDENFDSPSYKSNRRFFEPEIQIESKYNTIANLNALYPGANIGDILALYLEDFKSNVTPVIAKKNIEIYRYIRAKIARDEADTYIDLYDESSIQNFQNLTIGQIESYTGYPNAKGSELEILT